MKTLTLLRHAKSTWDDPVERDFDRPLNGRGRRAANRIGRYMHDEDLRFDCVYASPALRVVQTIEGVQDGYGRSLGTHFDQRLYLASATALLDFIHEIDNEYDSLLLIGHNPGLEDLVLLLTPDDDGDLRGQVKVKYPTATLAELRFKIDRWTEAIEHSGELVRFMRPRELDPTLGPDMA